MFFFIHTYTHSLPLCSSLSPKVIGCSFLWFHFLTFSFKVNALFFGLTSSSFLWSVPRGGLFKLQRADLGACEHNLIKIEWWKLFTDLLWRLGEVRLRIFRQIARFHPYKKLLNVPRIEVRLKGCEILNINLPTKVPLFKTQ